MHHGMWKANRADVLGEPALLPLKSSLQPPQTVSPWGNLALMEFNSCTLLSAHLNLTLPGSPPNTPMGLVRPWHL